MFAVLLKGYIFCFNNTPFEPGCTMKECEAFLKMNESVLRVALNKSPDSEVLTRMDQIFLLSMREKRAWPELCECLAQLQCDVQQEQGFRTLFKQYKS